MSFIASFAVIGMSIQNTYMRKLLNHYTPNTVMTGNFTQFSIDLFNLADHAVNRQATKDELSVRFSIGSLKKVSMALLGFLSGCGVGARVGAKINKGFNKSLKPLTILCDRVRIVSQYGKDNLIFLQKGKKLKQIGEFGKSIDGNKIIKNMLKANSAYARGIISPLTFSNLVKNKGDWDL